MTYIRMTEDERTTLTNALHVAANRYDKDATKLREYLSDDSANPLFYSTFRIYKALLDQFDKQAADARRLADLIDNAEYIQIGPQTK